MTRTQLTVFARITHALTSVGYVVAVWVVAVLTAYLLVSPAYGQTDQPCGKGGTAKVANGEIVTRTDAEATAQNARIRADGYWWTCPVPEYIPPPKLPADCVPKDQGFRTWTVGPHTCTTARRNASSPTDPGRDRLIRHNRTDIWTQWTGSMRGQLIERCSDGVRTVTGSTCEPVAYCDSRFSTSNDGGKTIYVYDARPSDKRVPVGSVVEAVTADGKSMKIKCAAGDFVRVR
jgi:hypothetical protein